MGSKKILLVDDDVNNLGPLTLYLKRDGYVVLVAVDSREALRLVRETKPALVVLNPGLAGAAAIKTCAEFSIPILVLSNTASANVTVNRLESHVKDCVSKPVSPRNLAARIRTVLRRTSNTEQPAGPTEVKSDGLRLNFPQLQAYVGDRPVHLTPTEFKLLGLLMCAPNEILSRSQIIQRAVREDFQGLDRNIDTHISNLRRKLEPDIYHPKYIQTVYRGGYKFVGGTQIVA